MGRSLAATVGHKKHMTYYTRVLSTKMECIPLSVITSALKRSKTTAVITTNNYNNETTWEQIIIAFPSGVDIVSIERNVIINGSDGAKEIEEYEAIMDEALPKSSARWLKEYFPQVRCIYAFQHLKGANKDEGFTALSSVRNAIWNAAPGIIQADGEGFTNEDGYHILWQFSNSVTGEWWMGLLLEGTWKLFQMDLGNKIQRKSFLEGKIPQGVTLK